MLQYANYEVKEILYENNNEILCKALRLSDTAFVIIKAVNKDAAPSCMLMLIKNEIDICKSIESDAILKINRFEENDKYYLIEYDYFDGRPLINYIEEGSMDLSLIFTISIKLCSILEQIHNHKIIHNNIKPQNILFDIKSNSLVLAGFGFSSKFGKNINNANLLIIDDNLYYISPEQTGRMNCNTDYRTDFYSLGVTLYQLFTNTLPFYSSDPNEIIHSHIARNPSEPYLLKSYIPEALYEIIMKLLSKSPDGRYSTAKGIRLDLEECKIQWDKKKRIDYFKIGSNDISDNIRFADKLYGRAEELHRIQEIFDRVKHGSCEAVVLTGNSGVGCSSLVLEAIKQIGHHTVNFVHGKLEHDKCNVPYYSIIHSFNKLIDKILMENERNIKLWRTRLQKALGVNGQVIIDIIPKLELIIGKQLAVPQLKAEQIQNRFGMVFQRFIRVFADTNKPLILFFDNLQYVDNATINLIRNIMGNVKNKNILIITTIIETERSRAKLVKAWMKKMKKKGALINYIPVLPLKDEDITELIYEAFNCSQEKAISLSRFVMDMSGGIPLIAKQLLQSLYKEQLIFYNNNENCYDWNIQKIAFYGESNYSSGVIENTINKAANNVKALLECASCIGSEFETEILKDLSEMNYSTFHEVLRECTNTGLIIPNDAKNEAYRFLHKRIQQVFMNKLNDELKEYYNLKLGLIELRRTENEELEERIYNIVHRLNHGAKYINGMEEKLKLVELNLMAGLKAIKSNAYASAIHYLKTAISLLPEKCWEEAHYLTFRLFSAYLECKYYNNEQEEANKIFKYIIDNIENEKEYIELYCIRVNFYANNFDNQKAFAAGIECLKRLNMNILEQNNKQKIKQKIKMLLDNFSLRKISELYDLSEMTDEIAIAVMNLLESLILPALYTSKYYLSIILCEMIKLSSEKGNSVSSSIAYTVFGMLIFTEHGFCELGYEFGRVGCNLAEKYNTADYKARVYQGFGQFSTLVDNKLISNVEYLIQAQKYAHEIGDLVFIGYNSCHILATLMMSGCHIDGLISEINNNIETVKETCDNNLFGILNNIKASLLILQSPENIDITVEYSDADLKMNSIYYIFVIQSYYITEQYEKALDIAENIESYICNSIGMAQTALFHFYYALTIAALYNNLALYTEKNYMKKLDSQIKELKRWASISPMNFTSLYYMAKAEKARVTGESSKVMELYQNAVDNAKNNELVHYYALANELAARYFYSKSYDTLANGFNKEAYKAYDKWGASAKTYLINKRYSIVTEQVHSYNNAANKAQTDGIANRSSYNMLDIEAVIKATQAISGEIVFENIIEKLMKISIESAGAERCIFIKTDEGCLSIIGEYNTYNSSVVFLNATYENNSIVPKGIINYVYRTKADLVLDNASDTWMFASDEYINRNNVRSVLCIPIMNVGKLTGIFYLENNLTARAFTRERIDFLKILFSQAAISIENAIIYKKLKILNEELEIKVEERTIELKNTVEKLQMEIAEKKIAETALQENEERLNTLINAIPDVICFKDSNGKILEMNNAALKLFCNDKSKKDFINEINEGQVNENVYFMTEDSDERVWEKGDIYWDEEDVKELNEKASKTLDVIKVPLFHQDGNKKGLVVIGRDISERKMIERHLSESEERYRTLVELSPVSILVFSGDKALYTNIAGARMLGFEDSAQVIGRRISDIVEYDDETSSLMRDYKAELIQSGHVPLNEIQLVRKTDGKLLYIEATATSFKYNSDMAVLLVSRDISERKLAEDLKRKSEENMRLLKEAMEYDKLKTEFFSNISHELKTPLNVILGSLQLFILLLKDAPEWDKMPKVNKYTKTMKQNCYRLLRLVNNLIDITKIDSGFFKMHMQNLNIINVIEEITLSVADYIESKNLNLVFDTEIEEKLMACDPDKIERIILNLLSNAIKFSVPGGTIMVNIYDKGDNIIISVRDNGIGIPEDKQQVIFERFRQVDKSFVRNHEGSGIGLALVKSLVELHQGNITLKSELNQGSEFIVELPVRIAENDIQASENRSYKAEDKIEKIQIEFSDIYFNN